MNFKHLIASLQRHSQVKAIAIAGKGGVGKSVLSANLALACAEQGAQVLLFDANLGLGNLDLLMGVTVKRTIQDVLNGDCSLSEVLLDVAPNVKMLPAAIGDEHIASLSPLALSGLINAFSELPKTPDVFIVDTPSGIAEHNIHIVTAAQNILLIVNDELPSLIDALAYIKVLSAHGVKQFHIIVNQVPTREMGEHLFHQLMNDVTYVEDVQLNLAAIILHDPRMHESIVAQTPLMMLFPHSHAATGFRELAGRVFAWKNSISALGNAGFFVEQLA